MKRIIVYLSEKRLIVVAGGISLLILIVLIISLRSNQSSQNNLSKLMPTPILSPILVDKYTEDESLLIISPTLTVRKAPRVLYENYQLKTPLPNIPSKMNVYRLKTLAKEKDAYSLGAKLGFTESKVNGNLMIVYNLDKSNPGYFTLDLSTGQFVFESKGNHQPLNTTSNSPQEIAYNFLTELSLIDQTVDCSITYQIRNLKDITYVECHRNWQKVGLPIINFLGLLNVPESKPLSSISLGQIDESTPNDSDIINTSTNQDGKKRPTDFNTVTVGVKSDGRIISISSNIKQIVTSEVADADTEILTPKEALDKFMNNESQLSFTYPAGLGTPNWDIVFPKNSISAKNAVINDYVMAYLENPGSQEFLTPMYVIRGTADLSSGYRAQFIQTLPAMKKGISMLTHTLGQVAGVIDIAEDKSDSPPSLKLGSFIPDINKLVTVEGCQPSEEDLYPQIDFPPYGKLGQLKASGNWYFILKYTNLPDVQYVYDEFKKIKFPNSSEGNSTPRTIKDLTDDFSHFHDCPICISAGSPTIFIYESVGTHITLSIHHNVTYSDPMIGNKNIWKIIPQSDGKLSMDGITRSYLYYEYEPIFFDRPRFGWMVDKDQLENFARKYIAPHLELTNVEENRLVFELYHASFGMDEKRLFIGLIPQSEINNKLPISISPIPNKILRHHFFIGKTTKSPVIPPILIPIPRDKSLMLELGATHE